MSSNDKLQATFGWCERIYREPSTPDWQEIYFRPEPTFIKSTLLTYTARPGSELGEGLPVVVALMNYTLGTEKLTVTNVREVLELLQQWDDVENNNIEYDTAPRTPERQIERNDRMTDIDNLIDATIRGLL